MLASVSAVVTDSHFVYKSGKHGSAYVNKDAVYPYTSKIARLSLAMAEEFRRDSVEVVIGPVVGGVVLSQWIAHHLTIMTGSEVLSVYAEKSGEYNEHFVIKRGYDKLIRGKRVLVVEDIINTGGSVKKVVEAVIKTGGKVVGVAALCNRGGVTAEGIGIPKLFSLLDIPLEAYPEEECPLCEAGVPINTDLGHGREFLARKGH